MKNEEDAQTFFGENLGAKKEVPLPGNNRTHAIPIAVLPLAMGYKMIFRLCFKLQKFFFKKD
ncbi:MAG: hypothetical protein H0W50_06405 [Parachlamydiaceae bacterium]|nr:hypothetical protein [Parachlamydiaceae bacterium]